MPIITPTTTAVTVAITTTMAAINLPPSNTVPTQHSTTSPDSRYPTNQLASYDRTSTCHSHSTCSLHYMRHDTEGTSQWHPLQAPVSRNTAHPSPRRILHHWCPPLYITLLLFPQSLTSRPAMFSRSHYLPTKPSHYHLLLSAEHRQPVERHQLAGS